jgi:serine protease Do
MLSSGENVGTLPTSSPVARSASTAESGAAPPRPDWYRRTQRPSPHEESVVPTAPLSTNDVVPAPQPVELDIVPDEALPDDELPQLRELPQRKPSKSPTVNPDGARKSKSVPVLPRQDASRARPWIVGATAGIAICVVIGAAFMVGSYWADRGESDHRSDYLAAVSRTELIRSELEPTSSDVDSNTASVDLAAIERVSSPAQQPKQKPAPGKKTVPNRRAAPNQKSAPSAPQAPPPVPAPPATPSPSNESPVNHPVAELVAFRAIPLDEPATSFEMTHDGRFLVITHQGANQVSVYDVLEDRVVQTARAEAPRAVICRNGRAFVANYGKGTVSVFAENRRWSLVNELQVDKPNVKYVSAAGDPHFRDELLVTCHPGGIYLLDAKSDRCRPILDKAMGTVSFDGKLVFTQDSFNTSPSGLISAWPYADFLKAQRGNPMFQGGIQQTPFVYQVHPGGYWLCENRIFGGVPIGQVRDDTHGLLIPDYAQKVVYNLTTDVITGHRLNTSFEELGKRKVELPDAVKSDFSRLNHLIYRRRDYLLDHPAAFTRDGTLSLFVLDIREGNLLTARTAALAEPSSAPPDVPLAAQDRPDNAKPPATSAAPPSGSSPMDSAWLDSFPKLLAEGQPFAFQFPRNGASFELMDGPSGMRLTPDGKLTWTPTAQHVGIHELKIRVERDGKPTIERPSLEVVDRALVEAAGGDLSKVDRFDRLDLEIDQLAISRGSDGKSLLLLQGDSLRILGPNGISVQHQHTLPERYHDIRDRENVYVALSKAPPAVDVFDKKTLRRIAHHAVQPKDLRVMDITGFAIHPTQPTTYLAIKHDIELPRYMVILVNERTGKIEAPGILGTFVEVDPQGKALYTGYKDIYERGRQFHINPDWRLIEIPQYGNVDMLISWDISRGAPKMKQLVREAGGNGSGLRLSPDGQRITYLSHVGYPLHSGNLVGISARNFSEAAVTYETTKRATTYDLDYHPTLPWVASPGSGSAVVFQRETGQLLEHRLLITSKGTGGDAVERVLFSPDGKSLILRCKGGETGRYLRRVPLRLDRGEIAKTDLPPPRASAPPAARPKIPAAEVQALQPIGQTDALTPKDIGKRYLDAVVVVKSVDGSGTGFVIGQAGYILTCAHVLPVSGPVEVWYNFPKGDGIEVVKSTATVIDSDEERDIALLKITPRGPLTHVALSDAARVDSGESVTVIGNPGLGSTILSHTMTTGIVSNPDRELDGQHYIQTSAAVNPGNSGGPMFDSRGLVVGLVSLKANIEGAGFAVPAPVLRKFLESLLESTSKQPESGAANRR